MAHFDNPHDGTLLSLLTGCVSGVTFMFSQINIYEAGIPNVILQTVSLLAGMIAIVSGIVSIRKNLKK